MPTNSGRSKLNAPAYQAYDPSSVEHAILGSMAARTDLAPAMMYPFYLNARDDRAVSGEQYTEQLQRSNEMQSVLANRAMAAEDAMDRRKNIVDLAGKTGSPLSSIQALMELGLVDPSRGAMQGLATATGLAHGKTRAEALKAMGEGAEGFGKAGLFPKNSLGTPEDLLSFLRTGVPTGVQAAGAGNPSAVDTITVSNPDAPGNPQLKTRMPSDPLAVADRVKGMNLALGNSMGAPTGASSNINQLSPKQRAAYQEVVKEASSRGAEVDTRSLADGRVQISLRGKDGRVYETGIIRQDGTWSKIK